MAAHEWWYPFPSCRLSVGIDHEGKLARHLTARGPWPYLGTGRRGVLGRVQTYFLDGCRQFNQGTIDETKLATLASSKGFANVIDAFHVVGQADTPQRFFIDERRAHRGIRITDEFGALTGPKDAQDLPREAEARWRLVETAWRLGLARAMVVSHDAADGMLLLPDASRRRRVVTSCRGALNGYQQGRCFYCSGPISLTDPETLADVDHFFPHVLTQAEFGPIIDGVWNLAAGLSVLQPGVGRELPSIRGRWFNLKARWKNRCKRKADSV